MVYVFPVCISEKFLSEISAGVFALSNISAEITLILNLRTQSFISCVIVEVGLVRNMLIACLYCAFCRKSVYLGDDKTTFGFNGSFLLSGLSKEFNKLPSRDR